MPIKPSLSMCLLMCLLASLSACSWFARDQVVDPDIKVAKLAIAQQRYADAEVLLRQLANEQNPQAQYLIGTLYQYGLGVKQSDTEAASWYRIAAQQDFAAAAFDLGYLYRAGLGVDRNFTRALYYYEIAAEQNHGLAQLELADMYKLGLAETANPKLAKKWYAKACSNGVAQACIK